MSLFVLHHWMEQHPMDTHLVVVTGTAICQISMHLDASIQRTIPNIKMLEVMLSLTMR